MNQKHVTSLELSKKLAEAGIPQESEWYWIKQDENDGKYMGDLWKDWQLIEADAGIDTWGEDLDGRGGKVVTVKDIALHPNEFWEIISAFHVGELEEKFPDEIKRGEEYYGPTFWIVDTVEGVRHYCCNYKVMTFGKKGFLIPPEEAIVEQSGAEARGKMLLYLKENKLI